MLEAWERNSMVLTIGLALDHAQQRGLRVDVGTSDSRTFPGSPSQRWTVLHRLLDDDGPGARGHVVNRDHIVHVSMDRSDLLAIEPGCPPARPRLDRFTSAGQVCTGSLECMWSTYSDHLAQRVRPVVVLEQTVEQVGPARRRR
jgi:hypothetical protein